ncbi:Rieske 2Fe-2S domain-containing protein [Halobellus sp. GM3]|uniref:Rieske 2Fe-2S domain-containing protein n=1 Tax=Halobellus sp. GM3 TaxID=3458410 RepID=UPI00403E16D6
MSRVHVGSTDEIQPGEREIVVANGTSIGLFNVDGDYYALENECKHQGGPACTGRFGGKIVAEPSEPGERTTKRISDEMTVTCPWHGWEYEIETGEHIGKNDIELEQYEVEVEDGELYVTI